MYPESYPISVLTWWIYFLIFDIWLTVNIPIKEIENIEKDEEN